MYAQGKNNKNVAQRIPLVKNTKGRDLILLCKPLISKRVKMYSKGLTGDLKKRNAHFFDLK
jgi:hypothetical protein